MNLTRLPYFFSSERNAGSSSLQLGHHVAQNSMTIGALPTQEPMSTGLPSRVATRAEGARVPTGIPDSWAPASDVSARQATAIVVSRIVSSLERGRLVFNRKAKPVGMRKAVSSSRGLDPGI